jgi:hypothetical protein
MNANPVPVAVHRQGRPVKALLIWLIDACAIVVLALLMPMINEFKNPPRTLAGKK